MKIFIVEDDANLMSALKAKFSAINFNVFVDNGTGSVTEALNAIKTFHPDYIILDLMLPRISGFDLLSAIKEVPDDIKAPVIIFTNLSDSESRDRCQSMGADYFFIKDDYKLDDFVEKIAKIAANRHKSR